MKMTVELTEVVLVMDDEYSSKITCAGDKRNSKLYYFAFL